MRQEAQSSTSLNHIPLPFSILSKMGWWEEDKRGDRQQEENNSINQKDKVMIPMTRTTRITKKMTVTVRG
jgi:hypothetical protein